VLMMQCHHIVCSKNPGLRYRSEPGVWTLRRRRVLSEAKSRISTLPIKLRIKRDFRGLEIDGSHKCSRFSRAVFSVHPAVFPFDAERALIADVVERNDDVFEFDIAMT
jgi:hypothetical protein